MSKPAKRGRPRKGKGKMGSQERSGEGQRGDTTSIYLQRDLRAQLDDRDAGGGVGPAILLQSVARRHYDLMWRERPKLEPSQWRAICDALNGTWLADFGDHPMSAVTMLSSELEDAIGYGLAKKWQIDGDRLLATVRGLRPAQAEAIFDVVRRFWARCNDDRSAAITAAGKNPDAVPGEDGWQE